MNLNEFNIKDLGEDLLQSKVLSGFVSNFINELKDYLEKDKINMNIENKYSKYWDYQNFMEDSVAATIGLSRWATDIKYSSELNNAVENSILKISEKERIIYRKQFPANGSDKGQFYNIDKFENGVVTHIKVPKELIPDIYDNQDILFQYNPDGSIKIREDLKQDVVKISSKDVRDLKVKENEKAKEFKQEGHIYEAFEDDGYVFLNDLTEEKGFSIEDIDFVVNNYKGDGKYQVINGEYRKVDN